MQPSVSTMLEHSLLLTVVSPFTKKKKNTSLNAALFLKRILD
uniref:Uncharacterized protein n=1 Tax=Anguilla anguilla TaxID=7936 RepID=A0A0E9W4Y3_ANGAN